VIRHVAVFRFAATFSAAERTRWVALVAALPASIPEIRGMSVGEDVLHGPSSHEVAIVADFDTLADLETYSTHPAHAEVLAISGPVKTSLAVVDFEF
jgi:hypothetical protein